MGATRRTWSSLYLARGTTINRLKWQNSYSQGRMEIMRYRYGRMGRGEGRRETKGIEDDRKKLAKEKLS